MRLHSPAITGSLTLSGSIVIGDQQANPKSLSIVESVSGNFDAIFLGNSRTGANDNVVINMYFYHYEYLFSNSFIEVSVNTIFLYLTISKALK